MILTSHACMNYVIINHYYNDIIIKQLLLIFVFTNAIHIKIIFILMYEDLQGKVA